MDASRRPGFAREDLRLRYDARQVSEDNWHTFTDSVTQSVLARHLHSRRFNNTDWVLNAGAGVTELHPAWAAEVSLDLFAAPIENRQYPVCGSVTQLPFRSETFSAVVCVGEVLAYCDPHEAFEEFARVMRHGGMLICDFGSTKSWLRVQFSGAPKFAPG